ncbi:MAG TPA: MFS transporter [Candidatus Dormibacteraeota bacterium]|jgi:EmrB/QacA subfamily drug resistance transporter|nr:MFS transporter [Candidatus Dormibacteraeota bacterium]
MAIVLALCLSAFLISVDVTIVNVALPTLVRALGATTTELEWVVDAYSLVFAAFVLAAGSLSDRQGRKGTLLAGLVVFASGSLAGALVHTTADLITARAVMGVGAALMFPSTLSLLVNVFVERGERAQAIGLWGATTGVGIATGPIVGGWLLEHFWWGSIFAFMAAAAGFIAVLVARAVPPSRDPRTPPVDWPGFGLSSAGMAVLILGVIEAPDWGWGSSAAVSTMAAGAALLALFVLFERRTAHPMLDVGLFRNLRFTAASGSVAISFFALQGFIFLITQYFQFIKTFSPLGTGVRLLPVATAVAVASVLGTRLTVRIGNKVIVAGGLLLFATALLWTATVSGSTSYATIVVQMLLLGAGMGLTSAPATEAIMGAVPTAKAGVGSAVNDAVRLFGGTLGVAVIGSIAASLYTSRLASTAPAHLPAQVVAAAKGSLGGAIAASHILTRAGLGHAGQALASSAGGAFLHGLAGGCLVAGGVALAGAIVAGLFLPARPKRETLEQSPPSSEIAFLTVESPELPLPPAAIGSSVAATPDGSDGEAP